MTTLIQYLTQLIIWTVILVIVTAGLLCAILIALCLSPIVVLAWLLAPGPGPGHFDPES